MDYLRQLSNDEKRSRCATVATVEGRDLEGPLASPDLGVSTIPGQSTITGIYAVVTEAFAASATLDFGLTGVASDAFLADLDLTVVGTTRSTYAHGGVFIGDAVTTVTPNTEAINSSTGRVKLVIEMDTTRVKSGKYSA